MDIYFNILLSADPKGGTKVKQSGRWTPIFPGAIDERMWTFGSWQFRNWNATLILIWAADRTT